jgi:hypothetical protein
MIAESRGDPRPEERAHRPVELVLALLGDRGMDDLGLGRAAFLDLALLGFAERGVVIGHRPPTTRASRGSLAVPAQ